ncbi:MAG TPA: hypothetical protein VGR28_03510 [Candidatus Thermoplasmatota archaeon]|nr:hypothetical protein [Candidatus Thermoplasmatota archaeon]
MADREVELAMLGFRKDTLVATFHEGVSPWQAAQTGAIAALPLTLIAYTTRTIGPGGVVVSLAASLALLLLALLRRGQHRRRFLQEMKLLDADADTLKAERGG